nr:hypothetical protein CFP56_08752 [Quercus suber]
MEVWSTLPSTSRAYCKHIQFGTLEPMHTSYFNPQDDDRADDELVANDSKVAPKEKGTNGLKKQRKGARPNEGPLSVTLHEFFPEGFLTKSLMTTTHMVSCHDVDDQEDLTEKEEKENLEETEEQRKRKVKPVPRKKQLQYVLTAATR